MSYHESLIDIAYLQQKLHQNNNCIMASQPQRVRYTYPDLTQPVQSSNDHRPNTPYRGGIAGYDEPPPDYSTLPPPSVVDIDDLYVNIDVPSLTGSRRPFRNDTGPSRSPVTNPSRPNTFNIPPFIFVEHQPGDNGTQFQLNISGMDKTTGTIVNAIVGLGFAVVTLIGTIATYVVAWRQMKQEECHTQRILDEHKANEKSMGENNYFVPHGSGIRKRDVRDSFGRGRLHARAWQIH
jgi:hypothetical protein